MLKSVRAGTSFEDKDFIWCLRSNHDAVSQETGLVFLDPVSVPAIFDILISYRLGMGRLSVRFATITHHNTSTNLSRWPGLATGIAVRTITPSPNGLAVSWRLMNPPTGYHATSSSFLAKSCSDLTLA